MIESDLNNLFKLDNRVILSGNFNAHHPNWNFAYVDPVGTISFNYSLNKAIDIISPVTPTHFGNGTPTNIDFALTNNFSFSHLMFLPIQSFIQINS